ncbi:hypothetical protein [Parasitella parasitica]|uniref:Reverse transcriptase domain-containing protein n=1 Tax=Parasitella parasitica TaxID=35722 RepID=A0A0B7N171_9FUNG|nr:hypothetical protein [Parasitella parasitica]
MGDNLIRININGHLSSAVAKLRGLKQGDPLSPILYNLAFEPFLYRLSMIATSLASNAKFNHSKVQAFSVSGRDTWESWEAVLTSMNIMHLHSVKDADPLIYLSFPLIQSRLQRVNFVGALITKLKVAVQLHSTRSLSVVGRATVLNSLILTRIWYVLRVTPLTLADFQQLRSTAIQFLRKNIFPVIPWRIHLLFPCSRSQGLKKQRTGTLDMLYRAVDLLPRSFAQTQINTATAMVLPLTPSTIFKGLARGLLQLQPYFVPVCRPAPLEDLEVSFAPFVNQLIPTDGRLSGSAESFRLAVLSSVTPPSTLRNVSTAHWQMFWSLSLTTIQQNVVYRFIVGCIPHRGFLHHILPNIFDSSCCPLCLLATDSASHLLFHCPSKEQALLSLDFSDIWYCQYRGISSYRILFIALSQIWLAHMRYIFNQVPIVPTAIMVAIRSNVRQTIEEDRCNLLL